MSWFWVKLILAIVFLIVPGFSLQENLRTHRALTWSALIVGVSLFALTVASLFDADDANLKRDLAELREMVEQSDAREAREGIESSARTVVTEFIPDTPSERRSGSCWISSLALSRSTAWRCRTGSQIFDPCFELLNPLELNRNAVICGADPRGSKGFVLNLDEPLPKPDQWARDSILNKDPKSAWMLELKDGTSCIFMTGATSAQYERVNYHCESLTEGVDAFIIGDPTIGETWRVLRVIVASSDRRLIKNEWVDVTKVWR